MSPRTEEAYLSWIRRFIYFHGKRHPNELAEVEVGAFLSHLAESAHVAAATQNQALGALLFLYQKVLDRNLAWLGDVTHAKRPERLPVVLSRGEVQSVLCHMNGITAIMASLLYGSGLRLVECAELRTKDVDFDRRELTVRDGKGRKDRVTMLPESLRPSLQVHLADVARVYTRDLAIPHFGVALPDALDRKYPGASRAWSWQWLFPATRRYVDRQTGQPRCHHLHETVLQRAVKSAIQRPEFPSTPAPTHFATASPPTCWRTATTSVRSRNFLVTKTCGPQ